MCSLCHNDLCQHLLSAFGCMCKSQDSLSQGERLETAGMSRQGDPGPELICWDWESGVRDNQGDADARRMV